MAGRGAGASVLAMALFAGLLIARPARGVSACYGNNCFRCNSLGTRCEECAAGYFAAWDGFCSRCKDPLCTNCTGPGGSKCLSCQPVAFAYPGGPSSLPATTSDVPTGPFAPAPAPSGGADFPSVYLDAKGVCAICPPGYYKGPCAPKCTRGQYRDLATGLCRDCPRLCALCRLEKGRPRCTACAKFSTNVYVGDRLFPVYRTRQGVCTAVGCQRHFTARGCLACDQDGNCSKCAASYRLVDGACKPCKDRLCAECRPSLDTCQRCLTFFPSQIPELGDFGPVYKDRQGRCRECTKKVSTGCQSCNALGLCTRCSSGVLRNGGCAPCSAFVAHCAKCDREGKKCLACNRGYGLQQGQCVPCSQLHGPLCQECSNASRCTKCLATVSKGNFSTTTYLSSKGQCKLCPQGCESCRTDGSCHACAAGYRSEGTRCVKCEDFTQCMPCSTNTSNSLACQRCSKDGRRCLDCTGMVGFDRQCRRCLDPDCLSCTEDYTTCTYCNDDTKETFAVNGRCVQDPPGCEFDYEYPGRCSRCLEGWVKVGKACNKCADPLCAVCDAPTQKKCWRCQEYVLDRQYKPVTSIYRSASGRCQACTLKGCTRCKADGRCQKCQDGFLLIQGKCVL